MLSPNGARIKPAKHFMSSLMHMSLLATLHNAMSDTILPHATYETMSIKPVNLMLKLTRFLHTVREYTLTSTSSPASCKMSLPETLYIMTRHFRHNIVQATPKILATSRYCKKQPFFPRCYCKHIPNTETFNAQLDISAIPSHDTIPTMIHLRNPDSCSYMLPTNKARRCACCDLRVTLLGCLLSDLDLEPLAAPH